MQVATSALEGTSPEVLLARIAEGDKKAETMLVNHYYRGLLFVINRQAKNYSLAEDIAQETFIVVINKARQQAITNPAALSSFIRQTGINILIAHFRKESRRDTEGVENIEIHPPKEDLDVSRILYSEQAAKLTLKLINKLGIERDKQILRDFFVYEKTKGQICESLELTPEHFDRVLFRARQRLRALVEEHSASNSKGSSTLLCYALLAMMLSEGLPEQTKMSSLVGGIYEKEHSICVTPLLKKQFTIHYRDFEHERALYLRCG